MTDERADPRPNISDLPTPPITRSELDWNDREALVALALDTGKLGVWEYNQNADVATVDEVWCEIFGIDPPVHTIPMTDVFAMFDPTDLERAQRERAAMDEGEHHLATSFRIITPGGIHRWIDATGRWIQIEGETEGRYVGVVSDVTNRRHAELDAIERERLVSRLIDTLPNGAALATGDQVTVNRAIEEITGFDRSELATRDSWFKALFRDTLTEVFEIYEQHRATGFLVPVQVPFFRKDGARRIGEFAASITGENELWMMRDITEELELAGALADEQSRLKLATRAGQIGIFEIRLPDETPIWDDQLRKIFGLPEGIPTDSQSFDRIAHPDDLAPLKESWYRAIADHTPIESQFRIVRPDGTIRHIHANAMVEYDEDGRPLRIVGADRDITEELELQRALAEEQSRLKLATTAGKIGIFEIRLPDRSMAWDEQLDRMFGLPPGVERNAEIFASVVHPDDYPELRAAWYGAIETHTAIETQFRIIRPDGELRYIRAMGQVEFSPAGEPLRIGGANWDVTDEVELTQALAEEQSRLKLATDAGKIGIWELRFSDGRMTWDHQLREMFGLDDEVPSSWELFQKIVHPDDLANLPMELDPRNPNPQLLENEFRIVRPDGEVRRIRVKSKIENDETGTPWRAVGADWDITEEFEAAEALKSAKESAEAAERAKSEFLAMVSHEIRTPMNTVLGMTRLALQTELTPKQHNYLSKINASATSLIEIISDFLDFSKMEAGKLQLEPSTFKIDSVLESVSAVLAMRAEEKGLEIIFHVEPGTPELLVGDPLRIGQILINLVSNSIKFTDQGEIVVSVYRDAGQAADGQGLSFSVRDTGIGLDDGQIARIFKAFTQAGQHITRSYGGTGLGLAICKQLVELMGGQIWVESDLGQGSTFSFTIPTLQPVDVTSGANSHHLPALDGRRVLIVDDSASAREVLATMIRGFGMEAEVTRSGHEALAVLHESQQPFDLVLMDWRMPGIDGLETARRIKIDPGLRRMPAILMVTAFAREEILLRVEQLHLEGVLIKPVTESVMFNTVAEALGYPHADQAGRRTQRDLNRLRGRHILLVDDHALNREVISEFLTQVGITVDTASNGAEAIRQAQAHTYDAMLLDSRMPDMDGIEATRILRGHARFASLPILALSASTDASDRQLSLDAGATAYLTKPIEPGLLYDALLKHLPAGPAIAGLAGLRILVVDDNALNREVLEDFLIGAGISVVTASDGLDAIEKLKASTFDLVLMDIHMPRMDGLAATREIRKVHDRNSLPVIAVTAVAQSADREASIAAGMNAHLAKPVDEILLFDTISRLIATPRTPATPITSPPAEEPVLSPADSPEGIDLAVALSQLGGKHDRLIRLLRGFRRDFGNLPDLLPVDVEAGNFESVELIGHTLKSSAGYLGAAELAESATALDAAARKRDAAEVSVVAPRLIEQLNTVLAGIAQLVDRIERPVESATIDREVVVTLIEQALPLVEQGDYKATGPLDQIAARLAATPHAALAEMARNQFEELDLEASAEALRRVLAGLQSPAEAR